MTRLMEDIAKNGRELYGPSVGDLVTDWREKARRIGAPPARPEEESAIATIAGDATELENRIIGMSRNDAITRIQQRHYDIHGQWPTKRVDLNAVRLELGMEPR